jgi:hypothetical protein
MESSLCSVLAQRETNVYRQDLSSRCPKVPFVLSSAIAAHGRAPAIGYGDRLCSAIGERQFH